MTIKFMQWVGIFIFICIIGFAVLYLIGVESQRKESECEVNVCDFRTHDEWDFDMNTNICYCYTEDELIIKQLIK